MNPIYPNRRRGSDEDDDRNTNFAVPFDIGFRFGFQDIDQMINGMFKTIESLGGDVSQDSNTIYYGYQVNIGPDGKPHVREFGNVRPTRRGTFELASREPFVDTVTDEKDGVLKVIAEMPGVQKQDIRIEVLEDSINIKAASKDRNYETSVPLSVPVETESAKASYNNGILEVKLKLTSPPKPKGVNVRVD